MPMPWDFSKLSGVPAVYPADGFHAPGVQALFYETMPCQGRPTRSFAWMGVPRRHDGAKVPGIVLVHGGGGTAFDYWVRLWNARGYAAIAMDTCGAVPRPDQGPYGESRPRHAYSGPNGWGDFGNAMREPEEQWPYHAVADVLLAHSLLRAQPGVDAERIGITGISWGGYLTSIAAGVDPRFRFAMPVYGCGFLNEGSSWQHYNFPVMPPEAAERWLALWDPKHYLSAMDRPMCWVNGTNDFAYFMPSHRESYRLPTGPRTVCIRLEMPHGHGGLGENPRELHVFADACVRGEAPLARVAASGLAGRTLWATYQSERPILRAELVYTRATGYWPDRKWNILPARIDTAAHRADADLPPETTACFINLFDDRDCVVSSEFLEPEG